MNYTKVSHSSDQKDHYHLQCNSNEFMNIFCHFVGSCFLLPDKYRHFRGV